MSSEKTEKKVMTSVWFSQELRDRLGEYAERNNRSRNNVMELAISHGLRLLEKWERNVGDE